MCLESYNVHLYLCQAGVALQEERDFPTRLRTRNPGQGVVRVTMRCPPGVCDPEEGLFSDEVNVKVFPPLKLVNPVNGHLLLPQNGITRIRTNRLHLLSPPLLCYYSSSLFHLPYCASFLMTFPPSHYYVWSQCVCVCVGCVGLVYNFYLFRGNYNYGHHFFVNVQCTCTCINIFEIVNFMLIVNTKYKYMYVPIK